MSCNVRKAKQVEKSKREGKRRGSPNHPLAVDPEGRGANFYIVPDSSVTEPPLSVEAEYTPFVNFAMQQNSVPLLRALSVTNSSDKQTTGVTVRVWSDPPVVAEKILRVESIAPSTTYTFSAPTLTLQRGALRKQAEREEGHFWIEAVADGLEPTRQQLPLSVLAYNEWYGVCSQPELIAAHVLPNDSAVERILAEASKLLLEKTQDGLLSGYQSGGPGEHTHKPLPSISRLPATRSVTSIHRRASK